MNILEYRGYQGTAELDLDRKICRGKVLFITDLVTYETNSIALLQQEFESAIEDYLETCAQLGKEPIKPANGLFNVRVPPELHRDVVLKARREDMTLNEAVNRAIRWYCYGAPTHNHNYAISIAHPSQLFEANAVSSGKPLIMEGMYGTC
jgi:predicted HicB family RNase H-like nuclease